MIFFLKDEINYLILKFLTHKHTKNGQDKHCKQSPITLNFPGMKTPSYVIKNVNSGKLSLRSLSLSLSLSL